MKQRVYRTGFVDAFDILTDITGLLVIVLPENFASRSSLRLYRSKMLLQLLKN